MLALDRLARRRRSRTGLRRVARPDLGREARRVGRDGELRRLARLAGVEHEPDAGLRVSEGVVASPSSSTSPGRRRSRPDALARAPHRRRRPGRTRDAAELAPARLAAPPEPLAVAARTSRIAADRGSEQRARPRATAEAAHGRARAATALRAVAAAARLALTIIVASPSVLRVELGEAGLELARRPRPSRPAARPAPSPCSARPATRAAAGVRPPVEHARHRLVDVLHRDREEAVAGVRHLAGEQLEEDDAERVDVGLRVDPLAAGLLGRDVVARAEHRAGLGRRRRRRASGRSRSRSPWRGRRSFSSTFCGFTSRCTSPCAVGERERAADLEPELERAAHRQRAAALDELLQVVALDELEDDELPARRPRRGR